MGCSNSQFDSVFQSRAADGSSQILSKQLSDASQFILSGNYNEALKIGDELFKEKKLVDAIRVYQKIIERDTNNQCEIEGLGNVELATSRYEWFAYQWYQRQKEEGNIQGNAYDALGLCLVCMKLKNQPFEKKFLPTVLDWYQDALAAQPDYRLYLGYGHILYSLERYEQAIKIYNKVIQMRPKFIISYASLALLYEYKRIQKPKSVALAKKILQITPSNMYAEFILARNEKTVDEKIEALKKAAERHPQFVRIVNEIGICYGATKKQYRQAIKWYEKCINIVPEYAACYNNIGVNHQLLDELQQAMIWYFKCCQKNNEYRSAYDNLVDVFGTLDYTDEQILLEYAKYPSIDKFKFYYNYGAASNRRRKHKQSITWEEKAKLLNDKDTNLYNMMGMSYDELGDCQAAEVNYLKCVEIDPQYYHAYYNAAIANKNKGNIPKAIEYYKKAIEINPKYSYAYNNLGNIYKSQGEYDKAIQCYQKAVEHLSTYTLAMVNMAVCQLNLQQFHAAFDNFSRANEVLPSDNNNLSQGNRAFLRQNIAKFQSQGQKWRKSGAVDKQQKERLRELISQFENKFKQVYSTFSKKRVKDEIALNKEVLQIVKLLSEDKFQLKLIQPIYQKVKAVFTQNEEYFHIIPQIFIQYFWKKKIHEKRPIMEIERFLKSTIQTLSKLEMSFQSEEAYEPPTLNFKFANFNPPSEASVNLFKQTVFFGSYEGLYNEIDKVNKISQQSLPDFRQLVAAVSKRSNAIPYGVNMKLPKNPDQQFKVVLRILEKMFKKQITPQKVESIITKIDLALSNKKQITMITVVSEIMNIWTQQISDILKQRMKNNTETSFAISDLVRGKLMFAKIEDLQKALKACDDLCKIRDFQIIEMSNRLAKKETMDVVLKIKIKSAVCEFQLAIEQDPSRYHLIHCIYEIERSPLGSIFGSYLFMSKGFSYPILSNCEDIEERLQKRTEEDYVLIRAAAKYVISELTSKSREPA